jgi:hypothetical protein
LSDSFAGSDVTEPIVAQLMVYSLPAFLERVALVDVNVGVAFRVFPEDAVDTVRERDFPDNDFAAVLHGITSTKSSYSTG